jgi:phosphosulfolactate synthase (CoM biosynthesis protein A)
MGNPTAINELELIWDNYGKIYDLLGRELIEVPTGKIYIKNNKKCIRIK